MQVFNNVVFAPPLAYSRDYPLPAFSCRPTQRLPSGEHLRKPPSGTRAIFHVARARYALATIALTALKPGNNVLLPAYHCPAMVEPFLWAGCTVSFYPVAPDLSPVPRRFSELLTRAHAVVLPRYFGFEQIAEEQVLNARHDCLVIEDLAHAAFIPKLYGDVGVTSLTKFYPQDWGAEIWCAEAELGEELEKTLVTQQFGAGRWLLDHTYRRVQRRLARKLAKSKTASSEFRYFDEAELHRPASLCTLETARKRHQDTNEPVHRIHYLKLLEIVAQSSLGQALYPDLGRDTVPYMFPFLLHNPETFHTIRNAGIPLYRWEEIVPTDCEVSASYRERLIQIPCHQDMQTRDFALIERCLSGGPVRPDMAQALAP